MQIVIKFAKPGHDDENPFALETVREKIVSVKRFGTAHFNWHEAVATAISHAQPGEHIVAMFDEEYR